jgi:dihydromethanopterin reductase (acceptor)
VKTLWCVTGGEYRLEESVAVLERLKEVTVTFTAAGREVAAMYGMKRRIEKAAEEVIYEKDQAGSFPQTMRLKSYGRVVLAPCTANTVAKLAHGIADSLAANLASQALKMGIEVVIFPTDANKRVVGKTVSGKGIRLNCRQVDLDNLKRISKEVKVARSADELMRLVGA